jgi:branched-chain amino acid transport system ATP-binding protein
MLDVEDLHAYYGKSHILQGVSFHVGQGEIISLLGRNGAGRSTTVRTIMGLVPPVGSIRFKGERIDGLKAHEIALRGVGYVPEDREIFPGLTVRENLDLGLSAVRHRSAALRRERLDAVFVHFPRLHERIDQHARTLSGGEQQMLAIARVMMAGARLILMDEPTQGLAPALIRHIRDMIRELVRLRVTVLLVEQNARVALSVCDRGYIMEKGTIVFQGPAAELRDSPVTREKLGV